MAGVGPARRADAGASTAPGAGNQANSATFLVTSIDPRPGAVPAVRDSRSIGSWLRPGAAPFDPFSGTQVHGRGRGRRVLQAAAPGPSTCTGRDRRRAVVQDVVRPRGGLRLHVRRGRELDGAATRSTTRGPRCPDVDGHTRPQDDGLSCPTAGDGSNWQRRPPVPRPLPDGHGRRRRTATRRARRATGTAPTGSSGGWVDWTTSTSRPYAGKQIEVSITVATDPASLGLGVWVDDAKLVVDGATVDETSLRGRPRRLDRRPAARGHGSPENGWQSQRRRRSWRAASSPRTTRVYTGLRLRGHERGRTAGVHEARHGAPGRDGHGPARPGNPGTPATRRQPGRPKAKVRDQGRREAARRPQGPREGARSTATGDAGATLQGQGAARSATRQDRGLEARSRSRAGQTKTVKVKLSKKAAQARSSANGAAASQGDASAVQRHGHAAGARISRPQDRCRPAARRRGA